MNITLWFIRETNDATLYSKVRPDRHPTEDDEIWIPKSIVENRTKAGIEHVVTLPDWFVERKGL